MLWIWFPLTTMQLLKRLDVSPPDQFRYVDPDTGWLNRQMAYDTWVLKQKEHRRANGLPVPDDLEALMQDQVCRTIGPEWCEYANDGSFVNLRFTLGDVVTYTKALIAALTGNYVSEEEANRRARICAGCYLNVTVGGCGACHQLNNLVASDRSTPYDESLRNCAVCKCFNKFQVHVPLTILSSHSSGERQAQYPNFCWLKVDGLNYRA